MENLDQLREDLLTAVAAADSVDALEAIRVAALGRKGRVTELMKGLGQLDADQRRAAGQGLNAVKTAVSDAITSAMRTSLVISFVMERLQKEGPRAFIR